MCDQQQLPQFLASPLKLLPTHTQVIETLDQRIKLFFRHHSLIPVALDFLGKSYDFAVASGKCCKELSLPLLESPALVEHFGNTFSQIP
jgi:hypothetical protein